MPLNMVAHASAGARIASVQLALDKPWKNLAELKKLQTFPGSLLPFPRLAV